MVLFDGSKYTVPAANDYAEKEITLPTIHTLEKDEETGEWKPTGKYLYMDGYLFNNLWRARENAKRYNGDIIYVVDGEEGSGKSTLNRQISMVLDDRFTEEQICYSTKDAIRLHFDLGKWRAINLDESKEDLDRKSTMSKKNKEFNNLLSQSRQLHKFLGVTLPSIYDLDKYVAEHRASFLIHCYKYKGSRPGYFEFYGKRAITKLFAKGYKFRNYPVRASFYGRFPNHQVVDLDRYNEKKLEAIEKYREKSKPEIPYKIKQSIIKEFLTDRLYILQRDDTELTMKQISEAFGFSEGALYSWKREDERFNSLADKK